MNWTEVFTADEDTALEALLVFARAIKRVIDAGDNGRGTAQQDLAEVVTKIHDLQCLVMANALARLMPDRFRVLGGSIDPPPSDPKPERPDPTEPERRSHRPPKLRPPNPTLPTWGAPLPLSR